MSFEDIPEDTIEGYPCPFCEEGSVTMNASNTIWECDSCDFDALVIQKE